MTNVSSRRNAGLFSMAWVFLLALAANLHAAELPDFVSLVEKNAPAIVNVQATVTPTAIAQDLTGLRLAVPRGSLKWKPSTILRGLAGLPVRCATAPAYSIPRPATTLKDGAAHASG